MSRAGRAEVLHLRDAPAGIAASAFFVLEPSSFIADPGSAIPASTAAMFALPRTLVLDHRECIAVLASSALFLVGAMVAVTAIGG